MRIGDDLPSETAIAESLGVSRTISRSILTELAQHEIVSWQGRRKTLLRHPSAADKFSGADLATSSEKIERKFLEWILRRDVAPGARLNIRDLARRFAVTPAALNQYLTAFSRFGMVQREGREGWVLTGFTAEYARELSEFRRMIELDAAARFAALADDHPVWAELDLLDDEHRDLMAAIDTRFHDFSELDDRFHRTVVGITSNRFALEFQELVTLVFHYHYQWNKRLERERNAAAIGEHLVYLEALRTRDRDTILKAAGDHLATAHMTLLESIGA
nr:GntR family transcriptional regulator [Jiella flava]